MADLVWMELTAARVGAAQDMLGSGARSVSNNTSLIQKSKMARITCQKRDNATISR